MRHAYISTGQALHPSGRSRIFAATMKTKIELKLNAMKEGLFSGVATRYKKIVGRILVTVAGMAVGLTCGAQTLWYDKAPSERQVANPWMEYGLPIGNGQLGGMVMGGTRSAQLQLNEKTAWTGTPQRKGAYQNLGSLMMQATDGVSAFSDYRIALDLSHAEVTETWTAADGCRYRREYVASAPDSCIALHLTATHKGALNMRLSLCGTHGETSHYAGAEGWMATQLDLVSMAVGLRVVTADGRVTATEEDLTLSGATEAVVLLTASTDFDPLASDFLTPQHGTDAVLTQVRQRLRETETDWGFLRLRHLYDYLPLFDRMTLTLTDEEPAMPTDSLVMRYGDGATEAEQRYLEQLYFAFGRYLLIASSRGVALPANLQGIWNNSNTPPWDSDMHANINVQMNYWPAEVTNLPETHLPLLDWVHDYALLRPEWQERGREVAGAGWLCYWENGIFAFSQMPAANHRYCAAPAWLCWHLWQHYRYTQDADFLRERALPVMLSCVRFWMHRLVRDRNDGLWVCPQEWSPEQGPLDDGTAHSQQCVYTLFDTTLRAIDETGSGATDLTGAELALMREKFAELDDGLHTEAYDGRYGNPANGVGKGDLLLREWKNYSSTVAATEQQHRHVSHLMCLFPFALATPGHPLMQAVENSMLLRGERNTGWAMAWKMNLWARARRAEKAYGVLRGALNHARTYNVSTAPANAGVYFNLLDAHPPFQIDGNFGACAGMAEMLLQSYADTLRLLPALPKAWAAEGRVKGICGEGGFELDFEWRDAQITRLTVRSRAVRECHLQLPLGFDAKVVADGLEPDTYGETAVCKAGTNSRLDFPTTTDASYSLYPAEKVGIMDVALDRRDTDLKHQAYDLSGRRLSARPTKGLYIEDGKVRVGMKK